MTYADVATMLAKLNIPFAYYQFPEGTEQACPFICFYFSGSNDLAADNKNYQKIRPLTIELYTDNKDFALEETVESALTENELVYSRDEVFIDSEKMNMVTYLTEIVLTQEEEINGRY